MNESYQTRLIELFHDGLSDEVIAIRLGKPQRCIENYRRKLKLFRISHKPIENPEHFRLQIDSMVKNNCPNFEIIKALNTTKFEIYKSRERLGIPNPLRNIIKKREEEATRKRLLRAQSPPKTKRKVYQFTWPDYAGMIAKELSQIHQEDFTTTPPDKFKKFISTPEGQVYLCQRFAPPPTVRYK